MGKRYIKNAVNFPREYRKWAFWSKKGVFDRGGWEELGYGGDLSGGFEVLWG